MLPLTMMNGDDIASKFQANVFISWDHNMDIQQLGLKQLSTVDRLKHLSIGDRLKQLSTVDRPRDNDNIVTQKH